MFRNGVNKIRMAKDRYKLKEKSDNDLHDWLCQQEPGTAKYNSGVLESMRRVAIIEEALEETERPPRKRIMIAASVAVITIIAAILTIILFL